MSQIATIIGPNDHGRRMSLDEFDHAEVQEGFSYELGKLVVDVSDLPEPGHGEIIEALREALYAYKIANRGIIHAIHGNGECKLLVGPTQSERHPDLSIYLAPPPQDADVWSVWIPAVVIEVVSESSRDRDYNDKPLDYATFGVPEYWLFDRTKKEVVIHKRRRGMYVPQVLKSGETYQTTLLPGFELRLDEIFRATSG